MKKSKGDNKFIKYLKDLKRKEKLLLFTSILIFSFLIVEELVIKPLNNKNENLQSEMAKLNNEKTEALYGITKQDELKFKLEDVTYNYNKILNKFPKTERQADILKDLTMIAGVTNIELIDIKFEKKYTVLNYKNDNNNSNNNININNESDLINGNNNLNNNIDTSKLKKDDVLIHSAILTVNGKFGDIVNFINRIEKNKRKININNLHIEDIKSNYDKKSDNILQGTIQIEYYNLNYKENEKYDFNKGTYGKQNYFK
ncbi:hypothetical protein [Clostridium sp. Ade.TY]|uniref:hypothetical protein n=1 Tax=Clostridium sp. Ade.TY TaxID=1391647 RepID=UPI00040A9734|nr:hypothetical protein [Clostridium sp. Ade.TY]